MSIVVQDGCSDRARGSMILKPIADAFHALPKRRCCACCLASPLHFVFCLSPDCSEHAPVGARHMLNRQVASK